MLKNLIPWKKSSDITVRKSDPFISRFHDDEDHPLVEFRREMDRVWNRFWDDWSDWPTNNFHRGIEVEDKSDEYVLHAELPGSSPEEIDVSISGNTLSLRAEHKSSSNGNNGSAYQHSSFHESLTLPAGVDTDKVDAQFNNGLLEVHLPKDEECKPRRIAVNA